jgi:hypothetical protein
MSLLGCGALALVTSFSLFYTIWLEILSVLGLLVIGFSWTCLMTQLLSMISLHRLISILKIWSYEFFIYFLWVCTIIFVSSIITMTRCRPKDVRNFCIYCRPKEWKGKKTVKEMMKLTVPGLNIKQKKKRRRK